MDARLKVNGQEVPIGQSRINLKKTNPLFVRDGLPSIRSLPFQLPALDEIRKIFGFPDNVHNYELPKLWPCQVYAQNTLFLKGSMEIQEATDRAFESRLLDPLAEFARDHGDKSIRDIDLGTVDYRNTLATAQFEIKDDTEGTVYTIWMNEEEYQYVVQAGDTISVISNAILALINADWPTYASVSGAFLQFLHINQPTQDDPYDLRWASTLGTNTLELISQVTVVEARQGDYQDWFEDVCKDNPGNYDYCMPTLYTRDFYDGNNPVTENLGVAWSNFYFTEPAINDIGGEDTGWEYTCLPCMKLKPLLSKLFEHAGYSLEVDTDFEDSRDFDIVYMINMFAIDEVGRQWNGTLETWEYVNMFKGTFSLNQCVPDVSFTEMLRGIVITFLARFDWYADEGRVVLRASDKALETNEEQNWEDVVVGRPHLKFLYSKGYTLRHAEDPDDPINDYYRGFFLTPPSYYDAVDPYVVGKGEEVIENPFGILIGLTPGLVSPSSNRWVPFIFRKGYSDHLEMGYGNWTPRLGFFRGFTEGTAADYPGGRSDDLDNVGNHIAGAYSLAWGGNYGLVQTRYKNLLYLLENTRPVEIYIDPAKTTMAHLDEDTPKRALGTRWILADYTLDLPARGPQKVTLYRF